VWANEIEAKMKNGSVSSDTGSFQVFTDEFEMKNDPA
jgi:hypothetical protein